MPKGPVGERGDHGVTAPAAPTAPKQSAKKAGGGRGRKRKSKAKAETDDGEEVVDLLDEVCTHCCSTACKGSCSLKFTVNILSCTEPWMYTARQGRTNVLLWTEVCTCSAPCDADYMDANMVLTQQHIVLLADVDTSCPSTRTCTKQGSEKTSKQGHDRSAVAPSNAMSLCQPYACCKRPSQVMRPLLIAGCASRLEAASWTAD